MRLLLLVLCVLVLGCNTSSQKDKTLYLTYLSEANSLDPRYGYEIPANHTVKMLFEGLMRYEPNKGLIPAVASHYTLSKDQKMYTFHLRDTLWSNEEPVTAYDFEYAWKSVINPSIPTQGTADFYPIKNVQAIVKGELPLNSVGIEALDAKTLVVHLEYPAPYFLDLVATSAYSPIYSKMAKQHPLMEMAAITNGPFKLEKREEYNQTTLVKNPLYWNASSVALERIEIAIIEDVATQLALFEKGKSDWFGKPFAKLPLDAVPTLKEKQLVEHFPERAVYWYFINTKKFPFDHKKVRRALALATNREEVVTHVLKEGEKAATSVNREHTFFDDGSSFQAQLIFKEALTELQLSEETFPPIILSYCNIETNHRIALAIQQQWQQTLKIAVTLDPQEWTTYYDNLSSGNFQIGGLSWHSRIRDPIYNLQLFTYAEDRLNMSNWEEPSFQDVLTLAQNEIDVNKRLALLKEAEALLIEHMPVIPLYFLTMSYAKNSQLEGVYLSEINEIDFTWCKK